MSETETPEPEAPTTDEPTDEPTDDDGDDDAGE